MSFIVLCQACNIFSLVLYIFFYYVLIIHLPSSFTICSEKNLFKLFFKLHRLSQNFVFQSSSQFSYCKLHLLPFTYQLHPLIFYVLHSCEISHISNHLKESLHRIKKYSLCTDFKTKIWRRCLKSILQRPLFLF